MSLEARAYGREVARRIEVAKMNEYKKSSPRRSADDSQGISKQQRRKPIQASPKEDDFLGRLSSDDPNYELAKRFYLGAWADSHGLVAEGLAGNISFNDFIESCVSTFAQGAAVHVNFKDAASVKARCEELDRMVMLSIRLLKRKLRAAKARLGEAEVEAALKTYSRRVKEIAARSKQQIFESQLAALEVHEPKKPVMPDLTVEQEAAELSPRGKEGSDGRPVQPKTPRRQPDTKSSLERLDLARKLAAELATLKQAVAGFCTPEDLKRRHPDFLLWGHLSTAEVKEIADGEAFSPKAYAESLTLRHFGLTSRETLKKDRRKLKKAGLK
jgi:hypothetical protein